MFLSASLVAIVLLYVFSTDALATSSLHPPKVSLEFDWDSIEQVIAFGDSYTFVLGTAGHVNYRCAMTVCSHLAFPHDSRSQLYRGLS